MRAVRRKKPIYIELFLVVITVVLSLMWCSTVVLAQQFVNPLDLLMLTRSSYSKVNGYTSTFVKSSIENPSETIYLKFRKPFNLYMKWVKEPHQGREVIYVEGQNNDKVIANPGGLIGKLIRVVKLDPEETRTPDGLYTIKDVGIGNMIDRIVTHTLIAKANNDLKIYFRGETNFSGREAYMIERVLPKKNEYLAHRLVVYVDQENKLPIGVYAYNWKNELVSRYEYRDLKVNPNLDDKDFSLENRSYSFRLL